jgi:hypothetical protein
MNDMSFERRIAGIADRVSELDGGIELARSLLLLSNDIAAHLDVRRSKFAKQANDAIRAALAFVNEDRGQIEVEQQQILDAERERLARVVAASPVRTRGYEDALILMNESRKVRGL